MESREEHGGGSAGARCPACDGSPDGSPAGAGDPGILGGLPTVAAINASARPGSQAKALTPAAGPVRCRGCGESLYRFGGELLLHRGTPPMLPMHIAAARLRNHLRRLAITRLDLIDGDCYLLPYYRIEGATPDGETEFAALAARMGDARLELPYLPPADLRPWEAPAEGAAGPAGEGHALLRIVPPSMGWREAAGRQDGEGFRADRVRELIHYPFWMMRVGDTGRTEGVWMDGIDARLSFHRMRLPAPMPSKMARAGWVAVPAVMAAAGAAVQPSLALPIAAAAWLASVPLVHSLLRRWNG